MGLLAPHGRCGPNKMVLLHGVASTALHRYVLHAALGYMLARWHRLPHGAKLDLYRLYLDNWQSCSEFEIWFGIFPLLSLQDRYRFYAEISLVYPDFAEKMQATWYQCTLQGGLEELD